LACGSGGWSKEGLKVGLGRLRPKENAELSELAEPDQEQNQQRENPDGQAQVQVEGEARVLEELTNVRRKGLTFARLIVAIFGNATSLFLTADSIVQSALVGESNANDETVEKLGIVEHGAIVKKVVMTNATEHAVTECWTVSLEFVDESGHCIFKVGVTVRIILFAKTQRWCGGRPPLRKRVSGEGAKDLRGLSGRAK
jgi:hypothetical protein